MSSVKITGWLIAAFMAVMPLAQAGGCGGGLFTPATPFTPKTPAAPFTPKTPATASSVSSGGDISLASGLVAYWKLDDGSGSSAAESVGTNTGTWQGTLGSQWTAGKINGGGNFNGSDNFVAASAASFPSGTSARSLSAWVNPSSTSLPLEVVAGWGDAVANELFGLYIQSAQLFGWGGGGSDFGTGYTVPTGSWTHLVATYDGTTFVVYANGSQVGSKVETLSTSTASFAIGNEASAYYYTGSLDEVGIWNRALSSGEVATLYNAGAGNHYSGTCGFDH